MTKVLLLTIFSFFFLPPSLYAMPTGTDCSIAEKATHTASRIRGLKLKRKVPCRVQDKDEVRKYLLESINEKIPQEKLRLEGEAYKFLGLLPEDFKYKEGLVELYTQQLGGYYDPEKEFYAMAEWMPGMMQFPIAVHELTHALQDQYFELDKLVDNESAESDVLLARTALIEGDATAVMVDFTNEMQGAAPLSQTPSVSAFMMQNITGAMMTSSFTSAPPGLQAVMIFPYVSGLSFAHSLLREGGYPRIDEAFKSLPRSTEEILHPEKYLSKELEFKVLKPLVPEPKNSLKSEIPVFQDVLGEFTISTLIGVYSGPRVGSKAAAGWGGDRVSLFERKDGELSLTWTSRWDSTEDSIEFFHALCDAYKNRFKGKSTFDRQKSVCSLTKTSFGGVSIVLKNEFVDLMIVPTASEAK